MTDFTFAPPARRAVKFKGCIAGPPGSGKTAGALKLAQGLTNGGRIALINTERDGTQFQIGKGVEWAQYDFHDPYDVKRLAECIRAVEAQAFDAVIVDSWTHFYDGAGGLMDVKDKLDADNRNSFANWGPVGKLGKLMMTAIMEADLHTILTLQAKVKYQQVGKDQIVNKGWEPVMRGTHLYDPHVIYMLDPSHNFSMFKDRYGFPLARKQLTVEYGREVAAFLGGLKDAPTSGSQPMKINVASCKVREAEQDTIAYGENEWVILPGCPGLDCPCTLSVEAVPLMKDGKAVKEPWKGRQLPVYKADSWEAANA